MNVTPSIYPSYYLSINICLSACVALGGQRRPTVELIVGEGRLAERRELLVDLAWLSYRARVMWCEGSCGGVCVCTYISQANPEAKPRNLAHAAPLA